MDVEIIEIDGVEWLSPLAAAMLLATQHESDTHITVRSVYRIAWRWGWESVIIARGATFYRRNDIENTPDRHTRKSYGATEWRKKKKRKPSKRIDEVVIDGVRYVCIHEAVRLLAKKDVSDVVSTRSARELAKKYGWRLIKFHGNNFYVRDDVLSTPNRLDRLSRERKKK